MDISAIKKLLSILERAFIKKAVLLQFLLIIGVLFESVGLGMLIPLVKVITDTDSSDQNLFIHFIKGLTGNISNTKLIMVVLFIFVVFYIFKTMFLTFLIWKQTEFTMGLSHNLSTRMYKGYLFQPYVFFLDKNSAILLRNVQSEVNTVNGYVQGIMYLQTEISILIGIVATLFFLEPLGAIIVFCFVGALSYILYFYSRKKITKWGIERQQYDGLRMKDLMQGLNGITELKLFHKERHFIDRYDTSTRLFYYIQRRVQFMQQMQRNHLELVLILSIALLSVAVVLQGKTIGDILPSLSLFLFAALRMLPSANRIISSLQSMRFSKSGVDLVFNELKTFEKQNQRRTSDSQIRKIDRLIKIENLSFSYPSANVNALSEIHLEIAVGSVIGIIGKSGSGKTTLINILTGLLEPTSGNISLDDLDITDCLYELRKFIGYVPQNIFLLDDTLKNNIAFGLSDSEIDNDQLNAVIKASQLDEVVEKLPDGINSMVGERGVKLSGGQRQRIGIARALYNNPSILILDEGTSALDNETEQYIMDSVAKLKGKLTIILVAHRYTTLHFCDIVYKMQNGRIVGKGKLEELV